MSNLAGIIETNEDCDCGTIRDCLAIDKCCVPRGRQNACKVKRDFSHQCHPAQGFCCTRNCTYNNLEKFNLVMYYKKKFTIIG